MPQFNKRKVFDGDRRNVGWDKSFPGIQGASKISQTRQWSISWPVLVGSMLFNSCCNWLLNESLPEQIGIFIELKRVIVGKWVWLSWQSGCFQYQRSAGQIQSSANIYLYQTFVYCELCIETTKIKKRGREQPFLKRVIVTLCTAQKAMHDCTKF